MNCFEVIIVLRKQPLVARAFLLALPGFLHAWCPAFRRLEWILPKGGELAKARTTSGMLTPLIVPLILMLFLLPARAQETAATLALLPANPVLTGIDASQQFLALNRQGATYRGEVRDAIFASSDPAVLMVDSTGQAVAKRDGQATLTATRGDRVAQTTVTVRGVGEPREWSFRNHVLPVMAKAGCNQGACHGALAGKGGFRLSLRGYDPLEDHFRITREAQGRRVELSAPARSLFLTKPTLAVKHKGGKRLEVGSRDYRILADWITAGAAAPLETDARLIRLDVLPHQSILEPGDSQRLVVMAHYSDDRTEDVTAWARFASTDETVARVDEPSGEVRVLGHGEGAVTVWFSSHIVIARVTSPFPHTIPEEVFVSASRNNFIDELVLRQLRHLNLKPSPRTTDEAFIRRACLDTIGLLPTPDEVRSFLASTAPDKRNRLIDELLGREEFVDYWTYRWSDVFLINGRLLRPDAVKAYYQWLRAQVERNTPWDDIARQVVTARGGSVESGASNFYAVHQDPESMAENVSQAFLSLSINCAKCHNHPLEKWTNDQYYSFANLFARVRAKGWGGDPRNGDGHRTLYVESHGDLMQPRTGEPQPPAPLDGEPIPQDDPGDRREHLAQWLTSPDNPYFTRSIANRVWAAFFGIGLVNPVDDLRDSNPASNEPLLQALADHLVDNRYNLKSLMRVILQSETYQRSSLPLPENKDENRYFTRNYPRRLMAEVLHDAITGILDVPSEFNEITLTDGSGAKTEFYPKGTRALELYDSSVSSYFLNTFGRNERAITCECERSNQPSMVQVLHLSNGNTLNQRLERDDSRVTHLLKSGASPAELVENAYLWCLSRRPTPPELEGFLDILDQTPKEARRAVVEDLFWALMTSREFLFQH